MIVVTNGLRFPGRSRFESIVAGEPFMVVVFIGVVSALFAAVLGVGLGWILHYQVSGAQLEVELTAARISKQKGKPSTNEIDRARAAELMARLVELTTGMASEVDKHTGNIEAINAELAAAKDGDAGAVVAAVKKILSANEQMQHELADAENRLQEQQRELATQAEAARTDELTRIMNRRALDEELKKCVRDFQSLSQPFTVMVVDVDHFKKINDTHGHLAGDEVLRAVAQALHSQMPVGDFAARYGGEEFVVVFRGATIALCRDRAEELRCLIHGLPIHFDGKEIHVAASFGLAEIREGEDERMLVRRADEALYISKKAGRNCGHWNDGEKNHPLGKVSLEPAPAAAWSDLATPAPRRLDLQTVRFSDAAFTPDLNHRVSEWKRTGHPFSVLVCALDDYEEMERLHGENMLQRMMTATAGVVSSCLRDMDQLASYGKGTLAVSLPTAKSQDAAQVAGRISKAMERIFAPSGILPDFTVSFGLAEVQEGNDAGRVFDRAAQALEAAQESSGGCAFLHDGLNAVPVVSAVRQPQPA